MERRNEFTLTIEERREKEGVRSRKFAVMISDRADIGCSWIGAWAWTMVILKSDWRWRSLVYIWCTFDSVLINCCLSMTTVSSIRFSALIPSSPMKRNHSPRWRQRQIEASNKTSTATVNISDRLAGQRQNEPRCLFDSVELFKSKLSLLSCFSHSAELTRRRRRRNSLSANDLESINHANSRSLSCLHEMKHVG